MPRKNRRFTGEDVKRFYCRNLSPQQRTIFDGLTCDWEDMTEEERLEMILNWAQEVLDQILSAIPYGRNIAKALMIALHLLKYANFNWSYDTDTWPWGPDDTPPGIA
jgi:hypothetical protein